MRKAPSKLLVLLIAFSFSASIFTTEILASNSEDTATTRIEGAENALVSAYQSVLEVEQVGANVSDLLAQLNGAGEFLAKAHMAYTLGDFDEAIRSASLCSEISESVKDDANEMRVKAYGLRVMGSWLTMSVSLVGVVVVSFGSFWGWRVFKRRYIRRVLKMKLGVVKDES